MDLIIRRTIIYNLKIENFEESADLFKSGDSAHVAFIIDSGVIDL